MIHSGAAKRLRWGILGCGAIARRMAQTFQLAGTSVLVAAGSRSREKAERFCGDFRIPHAHFSYESLLADGEVDAVYVAMPHTEHARWAIRAAEAGKHILCEKPLGVNAAEVADIIGAAVRHDVFLLEAYMYRCHPLTALWCSLLREGAIGELKIIQSSFAFRTEWEPAARLLNPALGGGGILDVGGYPVSLARLAAGVAAKKPFADPRNVTALGHIGETGVDEYASALLEFDGGLIAEVSCGVRLARESVARFYGTEGRMEVIEPFFCRGQVAVWRLDDPKPQVYSNPSAHADLYSFEVNVVSKHLAARQAPAPAMNWEDSLGQARVIDQWRATLGSSPAPSTPVAQAHVEN